MAPDGRTIEHAVDGGNSRTFTGREDDRTGLLYYRARYYDPASGVAAQAG